MTADELTEALELAGWLRDDGVIMAPWASWHPDVHKLRWQEWQLWALAGALMEKWRVEGKGGWFNISGCADSDAHQVMAYSYDGSRHDRGAVNESLPRARPCPDARTGSSHLGGKSTFVF